MRSRMLERGLATKRSLTPAPRTIPSAKAVMYRVIGTLMALWCLSLPATLDRADGARLAPSSPQFTEEMHDGDPKYYNSRVLYTSEGSTVTVHQRQFKGGTGGGGATRWRQGGIIERTAGNAAQASFGPGSWTDGELSPWYVYVGGGHGKIYRLSPDRVHFSVGLSRTRQALVLRDRSPTPRCEVMRGRQ